MVGKVGKERRRVHLVFSGSGHRPGNGTNGSWALRRMSYNMYTSAGVAFVLDDGVHGRRTSSEDDAHYRLCDLAQT